jgi:hypothetical protein
MYYGAADEFVGLPRSPLPPLKNTRTIMEQLAKIGLKDFPGAQILILTNLIYAFVLPVIDIFFASYIMRNSNDHRK